MALFCVTAAPLGYENLSIHTHKHQKGTTKSSLDFIFLGKKLNSKNNTKAFICKALENNGVTSPTLTTSPTDQLVVAPAPLPKQPSVEVPEPSVDGSTMSVVLAPGLEPATISIPTHIKRSDFPSDFIFGASTSALQTEGNGKEGGRAPSTWDSMISSGGNQMAIDSYSLYQDDVSLLKEMGMTAYRFSISWSRILPYAGYDNTIVNQQGIEFYNNLIDELVANGITPFVTMFHFDLPQSIQDNYSGFLSKDIIEDFKYYTDLCFKTFGDRVKNWITINEPYNFGSFGYKEGLPANSQVEQSPFVATHNIILSHAAAVQNYRDNYKQAQGGKIGISLSSLWFEPYDRKNEHHIKVQKASLAMMLGWYMDPLFYGEYPKIMQELVIGGLPKFTPEEKEMVQGSYDFIGLNYYTSRYVTPSHVSTIDTTYGQSRVEFIEQTVTNKDGKLIGSPAPQSTDIYVVPTGLRDLLLYVKHAYNNPEVYVTENGVPSMPTITGSIRDLVADKNIEEIKEALLDGYRINDISDYLFNLRETLADITYDQDQKRVPTNVKGYFVWSLVDNMEVADGGYNIRYGLNYVDYLDRHRRYRKASSMWFTHFLNPNGDETPNVN